MQILCTLVIRNEQDYVPYFGRRCQELRASKTHDYKFIAFTGDNKDKTLEKLKTVPYLYIEEKNRDGEFNKKNTEQRLAIIREEVLERSRMEQFDYMLILDSDIFFNVGMIEHLISISEKNSLDVLTPFSIRFPLFRHYDDHAYEKLSGEVKEGIEEVESNFSGMALLSKKIVMDKNVTYRGDEGCEHKIYFRSAKENGYKVHATHSIKPIYGNNKSLGSYSYPLINKIIEYSGDNSNYTLFLVYLILSILILYSTYRFFFTYSTNSSGSSTLI